MKKFTALATASTVLALIATNSHANTIKGLFTDNIGSVYKTAHFYDDTYTWYEIDSVQPQGYADINFESELLTLSAAFNNGWNINFGCCLATGILGSGIVYGLGVTRP